MKRYFLFLLFYLVLATLTADAKLNSSSSICFVENNGQLKDQYNGSRSDIGFTLNADGLQVFVGAGALHYQFLEAPLQQSLKGEPSEKEADIKGYRMDVELAGCNRNARLSLTERQPYYERYYTSGTGEGGVTARSYMRATYKDVYPGIDWVLYIKDGKLKHEFVVAPGVDPAIIQLKYKGAVCLQLATDGSLIAETPLGVITEERPYCFTMAGKEVASAYRLNGDQVSFSIASHAGTLVIDPALQWATYYRSSSGWPITESYDLDIFQGRQVYMPGTSAAADIATTGAHQFNLSGSHDAFLVKFDSSGARLWCTYYGGSSYEKGNVAKCDAWGNVYLAGNTASANAISTTGAHQAAFGGSTDAFLVKFDSLGNRIWGTYYGGANDESASAIAVAADGSVYFAGGTGSATNIASTNSYQNVLAGTLDAFIVKLDSSGERIWGTYFGGAGEDGASVMCFDNNYRLYFAGTTSSTNGIATTGSHQSYFGGGWVDGYLSKFDSSGALIWATYYGGDSSDYVLGLATDPDGNVLIAGSTGQYFSASASPNNIASPGSYMDAPQGLSDVFLAKFDSAGTRQWGTYYGSSGHEILIGCNSLAADNWGNAYMVGRTASTSGMSTTGAWQPVFGGDYEDGFACKFTAAGNLIWFSYYGGAAADRLSSCAWDGLASLYIVGNTASANGIATPGSFQDSNPPGNDNAFLSRINDCIIPLQPAGLNIDTVCANDTVLLSTPVVNGALFYTWSLPGGWSGTSTTNSINVATGGSGGMVSVTPHSACGAGPALSVTVPVYPLPAPVIVQIGNQLNTGLYASYQWYLNGVAIAGATGPLYTFTQQGTYTVTVTDSNGCKATSPQIATGIKGTNIENEIQLYPNPNKGEFTVNVPEGGKIEIYEITGRLMQTQNITKGGTAIRMRQTIAPGTYLLRFTTENNASYQRTFNYLPE